MKSKKTGKDAFSASTDEVPISEPAQSIQIGERIEGGECREDYDTGRAGEEPWTIWSTPNWQTVCTTVSQSKRSRSQTLRLNREVSI